MEEERLVKGLWIPIEIWKDKTLTWNEKILFLEIDSYTSNNQDCYFSDEYISNLLGISTTNANKTLSSLIKKGYVLKTKFDGRRRYVRSALSYTTGQPCQKRQGFHAGDNNIINNNYSNNKVDIKENKKKVAIDLSIVAPNMMAAVETWLQYKKEKGQSYKPTGFKMFYKKLCEISGNNPDTAMQIVETSMQNNYAGIFPLKNNNNNNYGKSKSNTDKFIESLERANEFSQKLRQQIGKETDLDF